MLVAFSIFIYSSILPFTFLPRYGTLYFQLKMQVYGIIKGDETYINQLDA